MKIAIIGTGISGLGAAYLLHPHHELTIYEKEQRIGGHTRTVEVDTPEGRMPVDTGFIVFNFRNYPLLTRLFRHLQLPLSKSHMSFGACIGDDWLEYGIASLRAMFAQHRNLLRPAFLRMLLDILHFRRNALRYPETAAGLSLDEYLHHLNCGAWFREYFLLAMGAAIWSTPLQQMRDFPAETLLRFFDNHGILHNRAQRPQWYTIQGGSRQYLQRLCKPLQGRIRTACAATRVLRHAGEVEVQDSRGGSARFDHVVLACHADQALALLGDPAPEERDILGRFSWQDNRMVLHSDTGFLPRRRAAYSSWVYLREHRERTADISLSYWMNKLQSLPTRTPLIVTLNPAREPEAEQVHDRWTFAHPVFDRDTLQAQVEMPRLQGVRRTWYCGAWLRYGFHEDGLQSAVDLAGHFKVRLPAWL